MDGRGFGIRDKEDLVGALRRLDEVGERGGIPERGRAHVLGNVLRDRGVVSGGGGELVERDDTEPSEEGPAPERRVPHYARRRVCSARMAAVLGRTRGDAPSGS